MTATCPECSGPRLERHPAGLVYRHQLTCALLAAEDATAAADATRARSGGQGVTWQRSGGFTRDSTATERLLVATARPDMSPAVSVHVHALTTAVRRRDFRTDKGHPIDLDPTTTTTEAPA